MKRKKEGVGGSKRGSSLPRRKEEEVDSSKRSYRPRGGSNEEHIYIDKGEEILRCF